MWTKISMHNLLSIFLSIVTFLGSFQAVFLFNPAAITVNAQAGSNDVTVTMTKLYRHSCYIASGDYYDYVTSPDVTIPGCTNLLELGHVFPQDYDELTLRPVYEFKCTGNSITSVIPDEFSCPRETLGYAYTWQQPGTNSKLIHRLYNDDTHLTTEWSWEGGAAFTYDRVLGAFSNDTTVTVTLDVTTQAPNETELTELRRFECYDQTGNYMYDANATTDTLNGCTYVMTLGYIFSQNYESLSLRPLYEFDCTGDSKPSIITDEFSSCTSQILGYIYTGQYSDSIGLHRKDRPNSSFATNASNEGDGVPGYSYDMLLGFISPDKYEVIPATPATNPNATQLLPLNRFMCLDNGAEDIILSTSASESGCYFQFTLGYVFDQNYIDLTLQPLYEFQCTGDSVTSLNASELTCPSTTLGYVYQNLETNSTALYRLTNNDNSDRLSSIWSNEGHDNPAINYSLDTSIGFISTQSSYSFVNEAPTIDVTGLIHTTGNVTISWTDSDIDDNATISLYYDTNNLGNDGTLIIGSISEDDTTDEYVWDLTNANLLNGEYYVYAVIDDGSNPAVTDYSTTSFTYPLTLNNNAPQITVDSVNSSNGNSHIINWTDEDTDDNAIISLYYDLDNTGNDGVLIANTISEDLDATGDDSFTWDSTYTMPGDYYIYAVIEDSAGQTAVSYYSSTVTVTGSIPTGAISGTTAGEFNVSPGGAATYSIPISLSPGTAGLEPDLSLIYSNHGANGHLGVGWSVSGLSVISLCGTTLDQDSIIDGVDLDNNDRFCLDGERLILVSGTYGSPNSEYRTEHETFSKITLLNTAPGAGTWFEVKTKSGLTMQYGFTNDSRIEAETGQPNVVFWAVNKVEDTMGNYYNVVYGEETSHLEFYPEYIEYTGNSAEGVTPYNLVDFIYTDNRLDQIPTYFAGVEARTTKLLNTIRTEHNTNLVREYRLEYQQGAVTSKYHLTKITECGTDNTTCFEPTTFEWDSLTDNFESELNLTDPVFQDVGLWTGHGGGTEKNFVGDFNGDGFDDIAGYHTSNQWHVALSDGSNSFDMNNGNTTWYGHFNGQNNNFIGDFNGDAKDDLITYNQPAGTQQPNKVIGSSALYRHRCYETLPGGSYYNHRVSKSSSIPGCTVEWFGPSQNQPLGYIPNDEFYSNDINYNISQTKLYELICNGDYMTSTNPNEIPGCSIVEELGYIFLTQPGYWWTDPAYRMYYDYPNLRIDHLATNNPSTDPNYTNDGLMGYLYPSQVTAHSIPPTLADDEWSICLTNSSGTGFNGCTTWDNGHSGANGDSDNNLVGDFNGDGRDDIAGYDITNQRWHVILTNSSGDGFTNGGYWLGHVHDPSLVEVGDFNGDGYDDLISNISYGQWEVSLSNGSSSFEASGSGTWAGPGRELVHNVIGDFNSDGKIDIAGYTGTNNEWNVCYSNGSTFSPCDIIGSSVPDNVHTTVFTGDFDNDDYTDIGWYNSGTSWHVGILEKDSQLNFDNLGLGTSHGGGYDNNVVGDFNGDGKIDMAGYTGTPGEWDVRLGTGVTGGFSSAGIWTNGPTALDYEGNTVANIRTGDFNGDGRTDLIGFDNTNWTIAFSTGGSFSKLELTNQPVTDYTIGSMRIGDFNGDGRTDVAATNTSVQGSWYVSISTGYGFEPASGASGFWNNGPLVNYIDVITGDFNGDGMTDLAGYAGSPNGRWHIALSTGFDFERIGGTNNDGYWMGHSGGAPNTISGDFNGDGKTDLAAYTGAQGIWHVNLSTGKDFAAVGGPNNNGYWFGHGGGKENNVTGDFNGDGLTDIAGYSDSTDRWHVSLSNGKDFNATGSGFWAGQTIPADESIVADLNGDGKADILGHSSGSQWNISLSPGTSPDLLNKITDGNGVEISILYKSIADASVHDIENNFTYPTMGFVAPIYVVSEYQVSNGYNGDSRMTYFYRGAQMNLRGRGFLGFREIRTHDRTNGILTDTEYARDHRFANMVLNSVQSLESGQILSKTTNILENKVIGGDRYFSYVVQSVTDSFELNDNCSLVGNLSADRNYTCNPVSTVTTINDYSDTDVAYGNITSTEIIYSDDFPADTPDFRTLTHNEYSNNETNWQLGRLTNSTVTHMSASSPDIIRTSAFEYDSTNGLLTKEITEPARQANETVNLTDVRRFYCSATDDHILGYANSVTGCIDEGSLGYVFTENIPGLNLKPLYEFKCSDDSMTAIDANEVDCARQLLGYVYNTSGSDRAQLNRMQKDSGVNHLTTLDPLNEIPGYIDEGALGYLSTVSSVSITNQPENLEVQKTYEYDGFGNITKSTVNGIDVIENRETETTYDSLGRFITSTKNSQNHTETKTFDPVLGVVLTLTGPNGITTEWSYDQFGRVLEERRADGTKTISRYLRCDANSNCPSNYNSAVSYVYQISTASAPSITYFDMLDREIMSSTRGFDGREVNTENWFNAKGQLIRTILPYFTGDPKYDVDYKYDAALRQDKTMYRDGSEISVTYNGLTTTTTNQLGQTRTEVNNSRGWLVQVTDDSSQSITNTYDSVGNIIQVADPAGNTTTIGFDLKGYFKNSLNDPDTGITTYAYNSLGELTSQTDANSNTTSMAYDNLGRLITRTSPEATVNWTYDTATNGVGKLTNVISSDGYQEAYAYDSLGRSTSKSTTFDSTTYETNFRYDNFGRAVKTEYPTDTFVSQTVFNQYGFNTKTIDANSLETHWQVDGINARGQITNEKYGNDVASVRTYKPENSFLTSITTTGGIPVQDLDYNFDFAGNLQSRVDNLQSITEGFTYDNLNRLTGVALNSVSTQTITYDTLGNITSKSDVGSYTYGAGLAGPHAVTAAGSTTYTYDNNGNRTSSSAGETITYSSYNKPLNITKGTLTMDFSYGIDYNQYKQVVSDSSASTTTTTIYVDGIYEKETKDISGVVSEKESFYVSGGTGLATVLTFVSGFEQDRQYIHKDHLGSPESITNQNGLVVEKLSFDAWGNRRNSDWSALTTGQSVNSDLNKGFTGHEQLDEVGLIHMGGRVYDPVIGRFLSADPFVQAPENLQNYNRYSYVLNNPLSMTDPSGYFFSKLGELVGSILGEDLGQIVMIAAAIAAAYYGPGLLGGKEVLGTFGTAVTGGVSGGFAGSFTGSFIAGESFGSALGAGVKGGIMGGAQAAVTYGVGSAFDLKGIASFNKATYNLPKSIAHGVIGGGFNELRGGKFSHGFISSASVQMFAPHIDGLDINNTDISVQRTIASAVVGGTVSTLTGGKFTNGAVTGAFQRMFNDELHPGNKPYPAGFFSGSQEEGFYFGIKEGQIVEEDFGMDLETAYYDKLNKEYLYQLEGSQKVGLIQVLFPAHTATFSVSPINGSPQGQLDYAININRLRALTVKPIEYSIKFNRTIPYPVKKSFDIFFDQMNKNIYE